MMENILVPCTPWSPDERQQPEFFREEGGILGMRDGGKAHCFGKWLSTAEVQPGAAYTARVEYHAEGVAHEPLSVYVLMNWKNADGQYIRREYMERSEGCGGSGWVAMARTAMAPESAASVELELSFCETGTVRYRNLSLTAAEAVPPRPVRIASAFFEPRRNLVKNLDTMLGLCGQAGEMKADILVFTEYAYDRGAAQTMRERGCPFPGAVTGRFSEMARKYNMYILVNLAEEEDGFYFNSTAVIDRAGALIGRYRKAHLPTMEKEAGFCPGGELPVFALDFGTIGMLICFDLEYPEAGRTLRHKGAEIIFVPTVGNYLVQSQMQARWNGVYVVTSGGDGPHNSRIVNPHGEIIASYEGPGDGLAFAVIDLAGGCYRGPGTGFGPPASDTRNALRAKRREDLYG
jgi:predicted amidohydrolase